MLAVEFERGRAQPAQARVQLPALTEPEARAVQQWHAVAETALGASALRVHRSHFVALAHLLRVARTARGTLITLDDGSHVPLSRRRAADVQARLGRDVVIDRP